MCSFRKVLVLGCCSAVDKTNKWLDWNGSRAALTFRNSLYLTVSISYIDYLLPYTTDLVVQGAPTLFPSTCVSLHRRVEVGEGACSIPDQVTADQFFRFYLSVYDSHPHSSDLQAKLNYSSRLCCLKSNQVPNPPIRFQTWWCKAHLHPSSRL